MATDAQTKLQPGCVRSESQRGLESREQVTGEAKRRHVSCPARPAASPPDGRTPGGRAGGNPRAHRPPPEGSAGLGLKPPAEGRSPARPQRTSPCSSRSADTTSCFNCATLGRAPPSGSSLRGSRAQGGLAGTRGAGDPTRGGGSHPGPRTRPVRAPPAPRSQPHVQVLVLRRPPQHPPLERGGRRLRSRHPPASPRAPARVPAQPIAARNRPPFYGGCAGSAPSAPPGVAMGTGARRPLAARRCSPGPGGCRGRTRSRRGPGTAWGSSLLPGSVPAVHREALGLWAGETAGSRLHRPGERPLRPGRCLTWRCCRLPVPKPPKPALAGTSAAPLHLEEHDEQPLGLKFISGNRRRFQVPHAGFSLHKGGTLLTKPAVGPGSRDQPSLPRYASYVGPDAVPDTTTQGTTLLSHLAALHN